MSREEGRYTRQKELVLLDQFENLPVEIIGVGAVGRQVALQLAAMGVPKIKLIDFDVVEAVNLAPQGFRERDLDKPKVDAVAEAMKEMNSEIEIIAENGRFRKTRVTNKAIVFMCVDDMDTRKLIFDAYKEKATILIDGRMSAESMRVFSVYSNPSADDYEKTLFTQSEGFEGRCTARSTIYTASIIAGLEISLLTKFLRGVLPETELNFNLFTAEFDAKG